MLSDEWIRDQAAGRVNACLSRRRTERTMSLESARREHLRGALKGLSIRLRASVEESVLLGDSLTKGEFREEGVAAALTEHLPQRYKLLKGIVIDSHGNESDPQDVLVLDVANYPPILGGDRTHAVPVEGVVGTIQVKSIANKRSVSSAISNIASAKRLMPSEERFGTPLAGAHMAGSWSTSAAFFGGAIFLSHAGKLDTVLEHYCRQVMEVPPRERCDVVCILDKAAVVWGAPSKGESGLHFVGRGEQAEVPMLLWAGEDSLLFFYYTLMDHLAHWISPRPRWLDYVFGKEGTGNTLSLVYSYWTKEEGIG